MYGRRLPPPWVFAVAIVVVLLLKLLVYAFAAHAGRDAICQAADCTAAPTETAAPLRP